MSPIPSQLTTAGWETAETIQVTGRLANAIPETVEALTRISKEWLDSMAALGQISQSRPITFSDWNFNATYTLTGTCGDATMALYVLLTETRKMTSVEAIGFFLPTDIGRRY